MGADWYNFVSMTAAAIPVPKEALQQPFNLPGFKLMTFMHEHYDNKLKEDYNEYHGAIICLADTELLFSSVYVIGPYEIPLYQASCKRMKHLDALMPAGIRESLVSAFEKYTGRKPDVVPGFWTIGATSEYDMEGSMTETVTSSSSLWSRMLMEAMRDRDSSIYGRCANTERHLDSTDRRDFKWLKYKVDQGADFIVTQLFYGMVLFLDWIKECRTRGIAVPTIPNIMPIESFGGFGRMTSRCNAFVLERIKNALEPFKSRGLGRVPQRSPAFGELDGYGTSLKVAAKEALELWDRPSSPRDVASLFAKYCYGEIRSIPWSDESSL
ncbi:hypothetical protein KI688_003676 [Linnemannia hyalina]|uniref:Methylenetetrahydrofolate reductase (NAD(P)H) n=1 Tax=Linnemannia hyalina TaxID=64524 RepID=A0A9P7XRP7_9FUNG|nr:hypothetical protein KI688_003676 [Linnemannia hyalina]